MRFRDACVVRYIHTLQVCLTVYRTTKNANAVPVSMPHTASDPLRIIRVVRRGEEASVRLLARQSLFGRDAVHGLLLLLCRVVVPLLLRFLRFSPVVRLSLLAVVDEEGEGSGQADDDEALEDAVVEFVVVVVVATRYAIRERLVVVVVVCGAVVVGVRLFEEVGNPFAEGPFFFGF